MLKRAGFGRPAGLSADDIAPVWVLDDPLAGNSGQAIGIAERLGVPHLRVPLAWNAMAPLAGFTLRGSLLGLAGSGGSPWPFSALRGPALAVSAGTRSEPVALWLRSHFGSRVVHCPARSWGWSRSSFDLLVVPRHERVAARAGRQSARVLPVLGVPHRLSPLVLAQARVAWAGRLAHMPRPIVTLLVGGGGPGSALRPTAANALARQVAHMAAAAGGSVLATTSPRTSPETTEALASGLSAAMNLLYRWGEPGENPYTGFLALADAVVVTGDSVAMMSEACGGEAPVFIAAGGGAAERRLHRTLYDAGQARPLGDSLSPWPRKPLDEAGRVAAEIRSRISLGPLAVD